MKMVSQVGWIWQTLRFASLPPYQAFLTLPSLLPHYCFRSHPPSSPSPASYSISQSWTEYAKTNYKLVQFFQCHTKKTKMTWKIKIAKQCLGDSITSALHSNSERNPTWRIGALEQALEGPSSCKFQDQWNREHLWNKPLIPYCGSTSVI